MDLTEADDIKKRQQEYTEKCQLLNRVPLSMECSRQEYTEEQCKTDLNDLDNHDGIITHLEPNILGCEAKWALEIIITNKTSGQWK